MSDYCQFCYTVPCRCSEYLVSNAEVLAWQSHDGDYLNRKDSRRLMATAQSLRAELDEARREDRADRKRLDWLEANTLEHNGNFRVYVDRWFPGKDQPATLRGSIDAMLDAATRSAPQGEPAA